MIVQDIDTPNPGDSASLSGGPTCHVRAIWRRRGLWMNRDPAEGLVDSPQRSNPCVCVGWRGGLFHAILSRSSTPCFCWIK